MSLQDYNKFLENPLCLEERYPTIEEFSLAFDDFFVLKTSVNRTDYENLYSEIKNGLKTTDHKKVLDKDGIKRYIDCFDLGLYSESIENILQWYIKAINKGMASGSTKNTYIRLWFRFIFAKAYRIRESTTNWKWLGNIPASEDGDDFYTYLNCLDEQEIKKNLTDVRNWKNFTNWKKSNKVSKDFVKIKSALAFLDDVNSKKEIVNRENFLINWFYSKCHKHFPCNESLIEKYGPNSDTKESPFSHRIDDFILLIDGKKDENSKEKIDKEFLFLKNNVPATDFPVLLYQEFKHALFSNNYTEAIRLAKIVSDIFFYVGSNGEYHFSEFTAQWYLGLVCFVAYASNKSDDSKVKTESSKLFTKLLKYSYLVNLNYDIIGYDNSKEFVFENSDKWEELKNKHSAKFNSFFLPSSFYDRKKQPFDLIYDDAKINQKTIFFGNISGYAIEIAARINNPQKLEEIIAKGGNVLKSKNGFQNALFWSINNMLQFLPIGYWRFETIPHSIEDIIDEDSLNFIIPKGKKTLRKYCDYNKVHAEELNNAYKIFKMVLPMYKVSGFNVSAMKFFENKNFFFTICSIGQYSIVEDAIQLVNIEELKKDSENYFFAVLQTYNQLFAYRNGYRRKIGYADRLNKYIESKNFVGNEKNREDSKFFNKVMSQEEFLFDSYCSFINENELLKIIDKLIDLHFDPCKDIPQKPANFPFKHYPFYDCTLFAIEMGWLKCVKRLCTYIKDIYSDHWEKMKKPYFAEALWQWNLRNENCTRYPPENEQKLILKFLAPFMK